MGHLGNASLVHSILGCQLGVDRLSAILTNGNCDGASFPRADRSFVIRFGVCIDSKLRDGVSREADMTAKFCMGRSSYRREAEDL